MQLRRRNFLGLIGAAAAAPLMPMGVSAAGASHRAYDLAVAHAQRFPTVSVSGMSKLIGIPRSEAQALIKQMSQEGLVGALDPTRPGTIRASSNIVRRDALGVTRRSKVRSNRAEVQRQQPITMARPVDPLRAHLYDLCQSRGYSLSERCFA